MKQRAEIENICGMWGKVFLSRKSLKVTHLSVIESTLVKWFHFIRSKNISVSGSLIKENVLEIFKKHDMKDFSASSERSGCFKEQ